MDTKWLAIWLQIATGLAVGAFSPTARADDAASGETTADEPSGAIDPDDVTIEQILAAWHARQDCVQSLRFKFACEKVMPTMAEQTIGRA
jgi:hypothetical protein